MTDTSELVSKIRLKSGLKNNQYYKDADLAAFASDGAAELYDIVVKAREHYFKRFYPFTLAGGVGGNTTQRPADFYKEQLLELDYDKPYPITVPMLGDLSMKNNGGQTAVMTNGRPSRQFFIDGDTLEVIPAPAAAGNYRLRYTPILETLVLPNLIDLTYDADPAPVNLTVRLVNTGVDFASAWPTGTLFSVFPDEFVASVPAVPPVPLQFDGRDLNVGDLVLIPSAAAADGTPANMGIFVYSGVTDSGSLLNYIFNRPTGYKSTDTLAAGVRVAVSDGEVMAGSTLVSTSTWHPSIDSTPFITAADTPLTVDAITTAPLPGVWTQLGGNGLIVFVDESADPFTIDGVPPKAGQSFLFTFDDAPIAPSNSALWHLTAVVHHSTPQVSYEFHRPYGFRVGDDWPAGLVVKVRGGSTMRGTALETQAGFSVGAEGPVWFPLNSMDATGKAVFQKSAFDPSYVGGVLTIEGSPLGDRSYRIVGYTDELTVTLESLDGAPLELEAFGAPTTIHVTRQNERYTVPQEMLPWVEYIVIHASIAVQQGRGQSSTALERKLEMLKARIGAMAANRAEDVQQAPITRGRGLMSRVWGR